MADYRLIYRNAGTGERTSKLSHLGFRVWAQYQLSADDFGVCPALASKLQGENTALENEPPRRVQAEIEKLIAVNLCQVFTDGSRRYLYQWDWQDWQRLKHATTTSLPPIPAATLEKCSPKTRALFAQFHPKIREGLPPHVGACDAPATADAPAHASGWGPGETAPAVVVEVGPPKTPRGRPGLVQSPGAWGVRHAACVVGFCDFVCLRRSQFDEFVSRVVTGGALESDATVQVTAWAHEVRTRWIGRIPGDDIFAFWKHEWQATHGSNRPVVASSRAQLGALDGVKEALRRG